MNGHRTHVCQHRGTIAPPDAIRLSQGRRYCPTGDCRDEAERIMAEAQSSPPAGTEGSMPILDRADVLILVVATVAWAIGLGAWWLAPILEGKA